MLRYFFHVKDGLASPEALDEEGVLLPTDEAAKREAARSAAETLIMEVERYWNGGSWIIRVVDERGREVCNLSFSAKSARQPQVTSDTPAV